MKVKDEKDFLHAHIKGKRTTENIKKVTKQLCKICIKYQCSKILLDVRDFTGRIDTLDIFTLASEDLPKIINRQIRKVAIIDLEEFKEKEDFFEAVAQNRGHVVQIFSKIDDAIKWL